MDCIILIRMPNDEITTIMEDGAIVVFPHIDKAIDFIRKHPLGVFPYQIVECDEL